MLRGVRRFSIAGEFTVPSVAAYDPEAHLLVKDVSMDLRQTPSRVRLRIKQSKTDPFMTGTFVFLGSTDNDLWWRQCWHIWRGEARLQAPSSSSS